MTVSGGAEPASNGGAGNWLNDARPFGGWLRIVIRNTRGASVSVVFFANTTNARANCVLSGFEFCGEPTTRPPVTRAV